MIALTLMAICIFPFIPKTSKRLIALKKTQALSLYALDFQNRMCALKEKAKEEGNAWIANTEVGKTVFPIKEKLFFKEVLIDAEVSGRLLLQNKFNKKKGVGELYKFKVELNYRMKNTKEKIPFYFYFTLDTQQIVTNQTGKASA